MFGMSLKGLGKELVFSEYGIGGGMTGDYKTPATNPAIVAASPYWGVDGVYDSSRDPWNRGGNRDFLRRFYDLTRQYAKRGGVNYPVGPWEQGAGADWWMLCAVPPPHLLAVHDPGLCSRPCKHTMQAWVLHTRPVQIVLRPCAHGSMQCATPPPPESTPAIACRLPLGHSQLCHSPLCHSLRHQVSAIFLWNIISYDVLGIHYYSSSSSGSYRDTSIARDITGHNEDIRQ